VSKDFLSRGPYYFITPQKLAPKKKIQILANVRQMCVFNETLTIVELCEGEDGLIE
jgi:hypothetical protein